AAPATGRCVDHEQVEVARLVARRYRRDVRALLAADAERVGGVLDVHALEQRPVAGAEDRPDEEVRVRRVRALRDLERALVELSVGVVDHAKIWNTASVTPAPSRLP